MLLQRADDQYRWEAPDTPEPPSAAARRMWYDTVGHGHVPALRCAIDSLGAGRLLLGTDFPYENGDTFVRAVTYINDPQIDTSAALIRVMEHLRWVEDVRWPDATIVQRRRAGALAAG